MVGLFAGGLLELLTQGRVAGRQRLRAVERLGTNLAHVIDAHERSGQVSGSGVERLRRHGRCRQRASRVIGPGERAQRGVGGGNDPVDRTHRTSMASVRE